MDNDAATSAACARFTAKWSNSWPYFRLVLWLDANPIVDRGSQALSATEIDFRCLNRDVPEEKLDLFEFTPGQMAKACTRATKIVRWQFLDSCGHRHCSDVSALAHQIDNRQ
jgi:hypothetical protein